MNYDIPVVCALCALKTASSGIEKRTHKKGGEKKKSGIFKVIRKTQQN